MVGFYGIYLDFDFEKCVNLGCVVVWESGFRVDDGILCIFVLFNNDIVLFGVLNVVMWLG